MLADFVKFILTILGAVFASLLSYELIEVGKKRKIETYWKIEAEYKSEAQQTARKSIEEVTEALENQRFFLQKDFSADDLDKKLVDFYNTEFHYSNDKTKRDKAWGIRARIRFLNQMGVLLKKKMLDKDLLFNLIGLGFEIDHKTLSVILAAHRASHNTPYLYNYFEYLWAEYQKWKTKISIII